MFTYFEKTQIHFTNGGKKKPKTTKRTRLVEPPFDKNSYCYLQTSRPLKLKINSRANLAAVEPHLFNKYLL